MQNTVTFLENLCSSSVLISDLNGLAVKLTSLKNAFPSKVLVIGDFDRTITRTEVNGRECLTTHNYIRELICDADLRRQIIDLQNHYLPIEFDPNISEDEKHKEMITWWKSVHDIISISKLKDGDVTSRMDSGMVVMRDDFDKFAHILNSFGIPFLVFSAGVSNVVSAFLAHFNLMSSNIKIVANQMLFDESGVVSGFDEPMMNTFNKNATQLMKIVDETTWTEYASRPFIFLFGDSQGDVNMCNGFPYEEVVKIGFVNNPNEDIINNYKSIYDIVVVSDQTFDVILRVFSFISS